jgi:hypothetical protein
VTTVISNTTVTGITTSSATISWSTNNPADTQVAYGTSPAYGLSTALNPTPTQNHVVTLSGLNAQTVYHYQVKSRDGTGALVVSADAVFTTSTQTQTYSIFSSNAPPLALNGLTGPAEVGVKFRSDVTGAISAVRFYLGDPAGTYQAHLWDRAGNALGQSAIVTLSTPGWQEVSLSNPVPIAAGATYVASYHMDNGHFSYTVNAFASQGVDNAPLRALANGVDGANGVYVSGASGFPTSTYQSTNYYVDVVFKPGS